MSEDKKENKIEEAFSSISLTTLGKITFVAIVIMFVVGTCNSASSLLNPFSWEIFQKSREELQADIAELEKQLEECQAALPADKKTWGEQLTPGGSDRYGIRIMKRDSLTNGHVIHCDDDVVMCNCK